MDNTILFVGDVCFNGRSVCGINWGSGICDLFSKADIVVYNLEGPIVSGAEGTEANPHKTCLKNPTNTLDLLPKSKFQIFNLANNHVYDYGNSGLLMSIHKITENENKYFGAGKGLKDSLKPIQIQFATKKIWLFSVTICYDTIPVDSPFQISTFHQIKQLIQEIRKVDDDDYVILNVHIGEEYTIEPSPPKKKLFKYLTSSCKIDCLISHHSHTPQPIEMINNTLVAYSLGNFVFDLEVQDYYPFTNKGLVVSINFEAEKPLLTVSLLKYNKGKGQVELLNFMPIRFYGVQKKNTNYYKKWRNEAFRVVFERRKIKDVHDSQMLKSMHPIQWIFTHSFYKKLKPLLFDPYNRALFRDAYIEKLIRKISRLKRNVKNGF